MLFTISTGEQKEIVAGTIIKLVPGFLPSYFDDKELPVTKLQSTNGTTYPYVQFYWLDGTQVRLNQESAISSEIIKEVI